MSEFAGKTVAVLNGSSEIGQSIMRAFLEAGAKTVSLEPSGEEERPKFFPDLAANRDFRVVGLQGGGSAAIEECERLVGALDVLVCAAPPVEHVPVLEMDADMLRDVVEHELIVPALLMQEAGRRMAQRGQGRVVVFFSMSGKTGVHTKVAPFAAAKGGLLAYVRIMAAELAPLGVTVNSVATSLFEPQVAMLEADEREALAKAVPVRRFGKPTEAAHAALFLASNGAAFITGETMNLSGGRFMD
jgi:NAD(P)-dependent dehydrogenase (short-subunit alcohol dehydrogenase family)